MIEIKINDSKYPCQLTMGGCIDFAEATGKEISEVTGITDMGKALFHLTSATCRKKKVDFPLTQEEFCDNLALNQAVSYYTDLMKNESSDSEENAEEKKS